MSATPWIIGGAVVVSVGGFLLWRRSQKEAAPTACERVATAAGALSGLPVGGDAAKTICSGLGNPDSIWDLPGPSLFLKATGIDGPCCCPDGTTRVHRSTSLTSGGIVGFVGIAEDAKTYGLADHRSGSETSYSCVDKNGNTVGALTDNGFVPYTPNTQPPPSLATPTSGQNLTHTSTITCVGSAPPAGFTWDVAGSYWRRLRVGETANPGPCATPATPTTTTKPPLLSTSLTTFAISARVG